MEEAELEEDKRCRFGMRAEHRWALDLRTPTGEHAEVRARGEPSLEEDGKGPSCGEPMTTPSPWTDSRVGEETSNRLCLEPLPDAGGYSGAQSQNMAEYQAQLRPFHAG